MCKRLFDISFSAIGIIIFSPIFLLITLTLVILDKNLSPFYKQVRIGKNENPFIMYKFRTMEKNASKAGLLTIGEHDRRITFIGYYLRKFKIDELPQLVNILKGDMSFVGPRPEIKEYTDFYTMEQRKIFTLKPGLTDWASIYYTNENKILNTAKDPEKFYINTILPHKVILNKKYLGKNSLLLDIKIIYLTVMKILKQ
jgi:lipopolysaccharide/colanic/teichoic acid biosynthesis glycosyltransferase